MIEAMDPAGNIIVGSGGYIDANDNALTFTVTDSDASGTTTLANTSISGPADSATLTYNGAPPDGVMPTLGASGGGFVAQARAFSIAPSLVVTSATFSSDPDGGMAIGTDGALYALETHQNTTEGGNTDAPTVARYVPGGSTTEYTYAPCTTNRTDVAPAEGLASNPDGRVYFSMYEQCSNDETGTLVAMSSSGTFASQPVQPPSGRIVESNFGMIANASGEFLINGFINCCNTANQNPPPIGYGLIESSTSGAASTLDYNTALGLNPATQSYYTSNSQVALDSSGNVWSTGDIEDCTNSPCTIRFVIIRASISSAASFSTSAPSGEVLAPYGMVAASDGNVWFTGELETPTSPSSYNFDSAVIGKVTPNGVITTYAVPIPAGASYTLYNNAILDGNDGQVYSLMEDDGGNGYVIACSRTGAITVSPVTTVANGFVAQFGFGARSPSGKLYFDLNRAGIAQIIY